MSKYTKSFIEYCKSNLDFNDRTSYEYASLSVCIIDCVYSLRTKYKSVTRPIVQNYANRFLNGDPEKGKETISDMISHFEELNDLSEFKDIVKNRQVLGGKIKIPKEQVCYNLARYLKILNIETILDFASFPEQSLLETVIRSVNGMVDAGTNYLFMLAGDSNRCKPDVHIKKFIKDACGCSASNEECQEIFTEAVNSLKKDYPNLTVKMLDGIIWKKYSSK